MGDRYMEEDRFHDVSLMEIRQAPRQFAAVEYVELLADEVMRQDFELERLSAENAALRGKVTGAIDDIAAERKRQVESEGWSAEHDDEHTDGSLACAAACYAMHSALEEGIKSGRIERYCDRTKAFDKFVPEYWPWDEKWWKPKGSRRNLVKAAALLIAEIERLDRLDAAIDAAREEGK